MLPDQNSWHSGNRTQTSCTGTRDYCIMIELNHHLLKVSNNYSMLDAFDCFRFLSESSPKVNAPITANLKITNSTLAKLAQLVRSLTPVQEAWD